MDNAIVKRGIGAIVLAIIAALLLGYLLKDKSGKRQDVVEMKLPGAPDLNIIPNLVDNIKESSSDTIDNAKATLVETTNDVTGSMKASGSSVIASATGSASELTAKSSNGAGISTMKPGFAIRPSLENEEKEIIDANSNKVASTSNTKLKTEEVTNATKDTIVASTKTPKPFKPRIIEKKKVTAPKKIKKPKKTKVVVAAANTTASSKPTGKYSIQLLATSSKSRAEKLAKTMKSEGYKVFVTQAVRENKILFRVRIGGHNDRSTAIKAQESMKRRYKENFFIQNSLVISN